VTRISLPLNPGYACCELLEIILPAEFKTVELE
jgi:hypothetical protein